MKIIFFTSILKHGNGGHHYDLLEISSELAKKNRIGIIVLGSGNEELFLQSPYFIKKIPFNGLNLLHAKRSIQKIIDKFNADIYHCFDEVSYNVIRLLISSKNYKLIVNKCGGPNPERFTYPRVLNLILFSEENLKWFKKQQKYQVSKTHLIPNRVKAVSPKKNFYPIKKKSGQFVFMRICRISLSYRKSILDSMRLVQMLNSINIPNVKLYIIGVVEDSGLFRKLKLHHLVQKGGTIFHTEPVYTKEASKMLYLADAVIGTGRGLMEAASLGKPILTINAKDNIPVLLDKTNFRGAFKTNFSERNEFTNYSRNENIKNIKRLVKDGGYYAEMSKFSKETFQEYFNIDKVLEAYPTVYRKAITGERRLINDSFLIVRSFLRFFKSYFIWKYKY
jgi:glycosyltransferase involved in cell wall biosynthesis